MGAHHPRTNERLRLQPQIQPKLKGLAWPLPARPNFSLSRLFSPNKELWHLLCSAFRPPRLVIHPVSIHPSTLPSFLAPCPRARVPSSDSLLHRTNVDRRSALKVRAVSAVASSALPLSSQMHAGMHPIATKGPHSRVVEGLINTFCASSRAGVRLEDRPCTTGWLDKSRPTRGQCTHVRHVLINSLS